MVCSDTSLVEGVYIRYSKTELGKTSPNAGRVSLGNGFSEL